MSEYNNICAVPDTIIYPHMHTCTYRESKTFTESGLRGTLQLLFDIVAVASK